MSGLWRIFLIVGVLVAVFLLWELFFNHGGILQTGYDAIANVINNTWDKITGGTSPLIPLWGSASSGGGTTLSSTGF